MSFGAKKKRWVARVPFVCFLISTILKTCPPPNVTFDPPWEPQMMTEEGKEILGFGKQKKQKKDVNWE